MKKQKTTFLNIEVKFIKFVSALPDLHKAICYTFTKTIYTTTIYPQEVLPVYSSLKSNALQKWAE